MGNILKHINVDDKESPTIHTNATGGTADYRNWSFPYTTWWVGDGEGDPHKQETLSKTYIETSEGKLTLTYFNYSVKPADKCTEKILEDEIRRKKEYFIKNVRSYNVEVKVSYGNWKKGEEKLPMIKPRSFKLPEYCESKKLWLYTLLPYPYFFGAKIRQTVMEDLIVE